MSAAPTGEHSPVRQSRLKQFFDRPTVGKTVLFIAGYLVFYLLVGFALSTVLSDEIDQDNLLATVPSILVAILVPVAIGGVALVLLAASVGYLRPIFARQPVPGRSWMWIAPILITLTIVAHLAATDWSTWTAGQVAALLVAGVCIGVTEELATRGFAVKMLRDAGRPERFVMVVSSALFALMHTVNLLQGMAWSTVGLTVVYTFCFGVCMYLAMRVTGTIWTAIVLHALTDPSGFLSSGGLDEAVTDQSGGASVLASGLTVGFMVFAIVAIFLVRGKADPTGQPTGSGALSPGE